VEHLGKTAREHSIYLVIGVVERDGGTLYCTVLFFAPDGELIGKHRKIMPTGSERLVWGFGDGSTMPVFDTPLGKLGAANARGHVRQGYRDLLRTDRGLPRVVDRVDAPHRGGRALLRALLQPV
jgi:hypothetical protein